MAFQIDAYLGAPTTPVDEFLFFQPFYLYDNQAPRLPAGALRIGGDSPNGLVLAGGAPAARVVDLLDRELKFLVATTTSSGAGTYAFTSLIARSEGYDAIIRGDIGSGERDVIIPGIHPG